MLLAATPIGDVQEARTRRSTRMGIEFFQTMMGKQFFDGTMPSLVRQLKRLNDNLEKLIDIEKAKTSVVEVNPEKEVSV